MRLLLIISLTFTILVDAAEPTPMEVKIQAAIDHDRRTDADLSTRQKPATDRNAYFPWTEGRYASLRINAWRQRLVHKDLRARA